MQHIENVNGPVLHKGSRMENWSKDDFLDFYKLYSDPNTPDHAIAALERKSVTPGMREEGLKAIIEEMNRKGIKIPDSTANE